MSETSPIRAKFMLLIDAAFNGTITKHESEELCSLLETDRELCELYREYARIEAELYLIARSRAVNRTTALKISDASAAARRDSAFPATAAPIPIILVRDTPSLSPTAVPSFVSYCLHVGPLSYLISSLIMLVAVLVASRYKIADRLERPEMARDNQSRTQPDAMSVGRVSAMDDCQWESRFSAESGEGPSHGSALSLDSCVSVGRKIQIDAGLIQITYLSGASIILEGPASFEVGANGGCLSVGRLTGELKAEGSSPRVQAKRGSPFAIRTPTAVVTDLGTEFGIEVAEDGRTTSHVFRGAVEVRSLLADVSESIVVEEGQSVRIEAAGREGDSAIARIEMSSDAFVRQMPRDRVPIRLSGTGLGLEDWQTDPYWEVVAVGGDPNFEPHAAMVVNSVLQTWPSGLPGRERWVSLSRVCYQSIPGGTVCTFRTTFDLQNGRPETALVRGRVCAASGVVAARLNGRAVPDFGGGMVPKYSWERPAPQQLLIQGGFVSGTNVLEIDVVSGAQLAGWAPLSPMGLRVQLEGSIQVEP